MDCSSRAHYVIYAAAILEASAACAQSALPGAGESYPSRQIRIIVPFTPGTGIDILARAAGPKLNERWGQPVVIDNRPGASSNIGNEALAKSAPDGYTLMVTANTFAIVPALSKTLPFDPD